MLRNVITVASKELQVLFKDRGALAVLFLLPLVLASVFGSISTSLTTAIEGEEAITIGAFLVNLDDGAYGQRIAGILGDVEVLDVERLDSVDVANQRVADGERLAAVVIPAGFTERVDTHEPSTIDVIVDPTQAGYGSIVSGILNEVVSPIVLEAEIRYGIRSVMADAGIYDDAPAEFLAAAEAQSLGVIMTQLQAMQQTPWIVVKQTDPEGVVAKGPWNPFSYNIPAFLVMFSFFLVGVVAESIWTEKEQGSMRRLLAAPIGRGSIIGGKILAYMLVICLQALVLFGAGGLVFDMPLGNDPLALAVFTVALAFVATGLGMLVATVSGSTRQADSLGMVLAFVLAGLGGCIGYPLYRLGGVVGTISRLTPHAHALIAYTGIISDGASLGDVLPQLGILVGMGVVLYGLAVTRFRYE